MSVQITQDSTDFAFDVDRLDARPSTPPPLQSFVSPSIHVSPSAYDPFSGAHKARPGELPSFSIDHYTSRTYLEKRKRSEPQAYLDQIQFDPQNLSSQLEPLNLSHSSRPRHIPLVFSAALAGESNRETRRKLRYEVNHEAAEPSDDDWVLSLPTIIQTDEQTHVFKAESKPLSADPHQLYNKPFSYRERTQSALTPRPSSIFFGPLAGVSTPGIPTGTHGKSPERPLAHGDDRFLEAIEKALNTGNMTVDLDNQGICYVPSCVERLGLLGSLASWADPSGDTSHCPPPNVTRGMSRVCSAPAVFRPSSVDLALILSNNHLSNPASLMPLMAVKNLQRLSLRANQLKALPTEIGQLDQLVELNLTNNRLQYLPSSVLQLEKCTILVSGNLWLEPPTRPHGGGRLLSKPSFAGPSPGCSTLIEACLRQICVANDEEGGEQLKKMVKVDVPLPSHLLDPLHTPSEHFWRCDGCRRWRVGKTSKVECYEWVGLGLQKKELVPVLWTACGMRCIKGCLG